MEQQLQNLYKALGLFIEAMSVYVVNLLKKEHGEAWEEKFMNTLSNNQKGNWSRDREHNSNPESIIDYHHLKGFALGYKQLLKKDFAKNTNNLPAWFDELAQARNKANHYQEMDKLEIDRAFSNMIVIARELSMTELEDELKSLKDGKVTVKKNGISDNAQGGALTPWFRNVQPHLDIRQGHLDESVFAANLSDVARGTSREIYQNPVLFFQKTFITSGIRNVANRVIKGLNGGEDSSNRIISLQTGFGGGKTHTLIALYHLVKQAKKGLSAFASEFRSMFIEPAFESASVAVFTNNTNDPTQGREENKTAIKTMWGEIAWQLGGKDAYEIIRKNDESQTVPKGLFKKVLEIAGPSLILLDEIADYCVAASGVVVGGSTLSDQTISFMQELSEAVSSIENCVVVATLPASDSEVASSAKAAEILHSLSNRLGRMSADTKPVADEEIFEVIRRRLFEDLGSEEIINSVIEKYHSSYAQLFTELPDNAVKSEYKEKLRRSYPFHPELIDMFRVRWASHHDFQRTRGVLRLLASVVSDLWRRQNSLVGTQALIHTSDVYFENLDALAGQLKKLYGSGYDAVITADVSGSSSNSFKIDQEKPEIGQWSLAQGIASTILLGSFGSEGANKGIDVKHIKLCVLKPDTFNHNNINTTLDLLESCAYYLYYTSAGSATKNYWFHTKPNINILISKSKHDVNPDSVSAKLLERLGKVREQVNAFTVLVNPSEDIPEQKKPALIILGPEHVIREGEIPPKTLKYIESIALKKGNSERIYRNTILFLVPLEHAIGNLNLAARELLACQTIQNEYKSQLDVDQREDIRNKIEDAKKEFEKQIVTAYQVIIKYSAKNGPEKIMLNMHHTTIEQQIVYNVLQRLKDEEWVLDSLGQNLLKKHNLFPEPGKMIKVKDIYESFLRYDDKPILSGQQAIMETVQRFCKDKAFAVGAGDGKKFTNTWLGTDYINIDINDDSYWLIDLGTYKSLKKEEEGDVSPGDYRNFESDTIPGGVEETPIDDTYKKYKSITISGPVDVSNYNQIFSSFIQPLRGLDIEISFNIKARSNVNKTIQENDSAYKIPKESAKQLGLDFDEEEM